MQEIPKGMDRNQGNLSEIPPIEDRKLEKKIDEFHERVTQITSSFNGSSTQLKAAIKTIRSMNAEFKSKSKIGTIERLFSILFGNYQTKLVKREYSLQRCNQIMLDALEDLQKTRAEALERKIDSLPSIGLNTLKQDLKDVLIGANIDQKMKLYDHQFNYDNPVFKFAKIQQFNSLSGNTDEELKAAGKSRATLLLENSNPETILSIRKADGTYERYPIRFLKDEDLEKLTKTCPIESISLIQVENLSIKALLEKKVLVRDRFVDKLRLHSDYHYDKDGFQKKPVAYESFPPLGQPPIKPPHKKIAKTQGKGTAKPNPNVSRGVQTAKPVLHDSKQYKKETKNL